MPTLIILGASARAAAGSAIRAGFTPWTADLFADRDLRALVPDAELCPIGDYPQGFVEILKKAPDVPWMYTGALENSPNLIRKMMEIRPLWGNGPDALLASRSPFLIAELLRNKGLPFLEVRRWDEAECGTTLRVVNELTSQKTQNYLPEQVHDAERLRKNRRNVAFRSAKERGRPPKCAQHCIKGQPALSRSERRQSPNSSTRSEEHRATMVHRWLQKPLRGAAGNGIRFSTERDPSCYFQQYIEGTPMSANFVRARGSVKLLGITEQLIGIDWLNAPAFRYAGNIGPVEVSVGCRNELTRMGEVIGEGCGLLGLFGVDFILSEDRPWVVEVNPRYTASVEVLERAMDVSLLDEHRSAFDESWVPPRLSSCHSQVVGKAILYARQDFVFSQAEWLEREGLENFADIPHPGDLIQAGWPILTILARGSSIEECRTALKNRTQASGAP